MGCRRRQTPQTHLQKKKKKTRMKLLLVVMLLVLFLIIHGSHCRISGADDVARARNKNHININRRNIYKTIRTQIGDVFDCVDIYKQPSLDHSLLKNHKIQLNPNLNLKETTTTTTKNTTSAMYAETELQISGGCPTGSVPIHRLKKTNTKDNIPWSPGTYDHWISLDPVNQGYFYGAKALINLQNPSVEIDQFSTSQIWVQGGYGDTMDAIEAGWAVHPKLFGDNRTRLFVHWTSDGYLSTGCFNIVCPGFVQVHPDVALGDAFTRMSVFGGDQYVIVTMIYHDPESKNWWLVIPRLSGEVISVGYWPTELFYEMTDHATDIRFGGIAGAEENRPSPPMGNGHFPMSDFYRGCFMSNMKKVDERRQIVDFDDVKAYTRRDILTCYNMQYFGKMSPTMEIAIIFGGPGGNC